MNCAKHADMPAAAYCRTCGKALCEACKRDVRGVIYCEDCLASRVQAPAPPATGVPAAPSGPHPALAGVLAGFFPFGVGQAYNGQYARGLVYLVVFIGLIWAIDHGGSADVVFGLALAAFYIWQIIDAVRSARYIQMGMAAPDPFGVDRLFGASAPAPRPGAPAQASWSGAPVSAPYVASPSAAGPAPAPVVEHAECCNGHARVPVGALILIGIGILLLLGNIGYLRWAGDFWPVILIGVGLWLLVGRWAEIAAGTPRGRRLLMAPAVLLVLGITFLLDSLERIPFHRSWPLILIVIGVVLFWQRSAPSATPPAPPAEGPPGEQPQPDTSIEQRQER